MAIDVKICGLKSEEAVEAAVEGGAQYVGFVFFPGSPRSVTAARAAQLAALVPSDVTKVGLFVDADDETLHAVLRVAKLDLLQLHGRETSKRVAAIKAKFKIPVMKVIGVGAVSDLDRVGTFEAVADQLLFDARPPEGASRPGGLAQAFDWTLLQGREFQLPWLLAGGLTVDTLEEAVLASGATAVDVSSGVEEREGVKSPTMIRAFLDRARELDPTPDSA